MIVRGSLLVLEFDQKLEFRIYIEKDLGWTALRVVEARASLQHSFIDLRHCDNWFGSKRASVW